MKDVQKLSAVGGLHRIRHRREARSKRAAWRRRHRRGRAIPRAEVAVPQQRFPRIATGPESKPRADLEHEGTRVGVDGLIEMPQLVKELAAQRVQRRGVQAVGVLSSRRDSLSARVRSKRMC